MWNNITTAADGENDEDKSWMDEEYKTILDLGITESSITEYKIGNDINIDDFIDMYYLKKNIEIKDLILQTEEVEEATWASREKIQELIDSNKFSSSHKEFYEYCLEFLGEQLVAKKIIKVN